MKASQKLKLKDLMVRSFITELGQESLKGGRLTSIVDGVIVGENADVVPATLDTHA